MNAATAGTAYSQTLTASGGTAPYSYSVTAGALPPGLTLSNGGVLSGTPTTNGGFNFTVTAQDAGGLTGAQAYSLTVNAPTIALSPTSLNAATAGTAYSQTLTASGGTAPYSYSVTAGALPPGLTLSSGGVLSGTPNTAGSFNFTVTAQDAGGFTGVRAYSFFVDAPTITVSPTTWSAATVGTAYSQTLTASGGTAPYSFTVTSGSLPSGLTLSSGGVLSGTPTAGGNFSFAITAQDANGYSVILPRSMVVDTPTIAVSPNHLITATAGTAYSQTLTASGGASPYTYTVAAGSLPAGLTLSSGGVLSGTPTTDGSFNFTVVVQDAVGFTGTKLYFLIVNAPHIVVGPATLNAATAYTAYNELIIAGGGASPYTYTVTAGSLPAGLTLSSGGDLSGTPTTDGSFNFTVTAQDAGGFTGARAYTLTVNARTIALSPTTLNAATAGTAYSQTFAASGGISPYSYTMAAGSLPAGLTLSSDGVLSGTPTTGGSFNFMVRAQDAGGFTGAQAYTLTVAGSVITVTPTTLPAAVRGSPYQQTLSAAGGVAPYSFTVTSGSLPAGLSLTSAGLLSGTPTGAGDATFTVTATDSAGGSGPYTATNNYTLTVAGATVIVTPSSLPQVLEGVSFSQTFSSSGGVGPYRYNVTAGVLPQGVSLSSGGLMSGTPAAAGDFSFTVSSTDAFGNVGSVAIQLAVTARPNPANDPEVRGVSSAQAEATRRLMSTQIGNFGRRLEELHTGQASSSFNLSLDASGLLTPERPNPNDPAAILGRQGRVMGFGVLDGFEDRDGPLSASETVSGIDTQPDPMTSARIGRGPFSGPIRIWAGGVITIGERSAEGLSPELSIRSNGISLGADMSLSEDLDVGAGVGFGREETDVGLQGSRMEASNWVGVGYASWRPAAGFFLDGVIGRGELSFDLARRVTTDGSMVFGQRDGTATFGSLTVGVDRRNGPSRWIGYGRLEATEAELEGFTEVGSALWALSYDSRDVSSRQAVLGVRFLRTVTHADMFLTPSLRLEWVQELGDAGVQSIRYADWLAGNIYTLEEEGWDRSQAVVGISLQGDARNGWLFEADTEARIGGNEVVGSLRFSVTRAF